jgi:transketolase
LQFESGTAETASSCVVRALARDTFEKAASGKPETSVLPAPAPHTNCTKVIRDRLKRHDRPGRDRFSFLAGLTSAFAIEVDTITTERRMAAALARFGAREEVK